MCGGLKKLPESMILSGIITREERGHMFLTLYNNDQERLDKMENNLRKIGTEIILRIKEKKRDEVLATIVKLNKKHNLPGINSSLEPAS